MAPQNGYATYQRSRIMTATPAELTLMLYDGAIKFCNIALVGMENKDIEKTHNNIIKARNVIDELLSTLNHKYPVAKDFENVYTYIRELLTEANVKKDPEILNMALEEIRGMRDTWKEVMKRNKAGGAM